MPLVNRLAAATSPYLLQHADNPVDWYPWGAEALTRAREEDRPIFLSIGYSACHWCHVMAHESFEDPAIAEQLNREFVAIKVDREERPDIDDVYMGAVQAMTGSGGWPLSVFLTPDLEPFFGGTYFPPTDRHGLPAFSTVLDGVREAYRERRDEVAGIAAQLSTHLRHQMTVEGGSGPGPGPEQLDAALRRLAGSFDPVHGGFGPAPKFPAPMTLEFVLRRWRDTRDEATLRMVTLTLDRMADGGIWDQLAGGFARYSTDARWLAPHFEKMLYDNALLAHAYLEAHRATGMDRYARVATDTLDFMLAELGTDAGGFAAALDADSEGEEGRFYVWDAAEVSAVLADAALTPEEAAAVMAYWDVTAGGNWEGHTILHVTAASAPDPLVLRRARAALLARRDSRVRPGRDDKQLAAWNGLALRAFALGALVLGDERFAAATRRLTTFIGEVLVHDGDRLWRTARAGVAHTPGFAEDYAAVADGLLGAYGALGEPGDLALAEALMARLTADFWDEASGTLYDTGPEHEETVVRPRSLLDGAMPSANAIAADVWLRLALVGSDPEHDRRARRILAAAGPSLDRQPSALGRMLSAADRALRPAVDVVVAGDPADPRTLALRRAAAAPYAPDLVIAGLTPGSFLESRPLFAGKVARDGVPTAYVCRGYACDAPTPDPAMVMVQVTQMASVGSVA
ncbi:MAG: thioredoxin domain-containing protein [Candidatus Limnocylindria bacterium]